MQCVTRGGCESSCIAITPIQKLPVGNGKPPALAPGFMYKSSRRFSLSRASCGFVGLRDMNRFLR